MKETEFKKYLEFFGADLTRWPEEIRDQARIAFRASARFQDLLEEERVFEAELRLSAPEGPAPEWANGILKAAAHLPQQRTPSLGEWLRGMFRPKPAFALGTLMVLGFLVGYWTPGDSSVSTPSIELSSLLYQDEENLWANHSK